MTKIKTLTLDYSKWRSGDDGPNKVGYGPTQLLNKENSSCCLGQWCIQFGIPEDDLINLGEPSELKKEIPYLAEETESGVWNTHLSFDCISINDRISTTPEEKISALTERLKKEGIELIVINKPINNGK